MLSKSLKSSFMENTRNSHAGFSCHLVRSRNKQNKSHLFWAVKQRDAPTGSWSSRLSIAAAADCVFFFKASSSACLKPNVFVIGGSVVKQPVCEPCIGCEHVQRTIMQMRNAVRCHNVLQWQKEVCHLCKIQPSILSFLYKYDNNNFLAL